MILLSDVPPITPDSEDADIRGFCAATSELENYLSSLSETTLKDVMALMYLGRDSNFDGVRYMNRREINAHYRYKRSLLYTKNKKLAAKHIAGKATDLHEFLEDGYTILFGKGEVGDEKQ